MVARTFANRLPADTPLLVTTVTPTGQAQALRDFPQPSTTVTYLPVELGFAVERFFSTYRPAALILVEGDYWPLVLRATRRGRHKVPVAVINGRVGDRSGERLRAMPGLNRRLFFSAIRTFAVQTESDRDRLVTAGAAPERIVVAGNIKFDTPAPIRSHSLETLLRKCAATRPILLAGSTMAGEEQAVLEALKILEEASLPNLLVLAPRHPERWDAVARLVEDAGFRLLRRSELPSDIDRNSRPQVMLLDSLGELAGAYRLAAAAFVGGTLTNTGGHNPIEPARFAVATAVGPSMDNFRDIARLFDGARAWQRVDGPKSLAACWRTWITDPTAAAAVGGRAADLVQANRGALARSFAAIESILGALHRADDKFDQETNNR